VGTVGSQQANKIQNELNLGNITLDDVYDTLINFAASPAVSALRDTPSGTFSAPDLGEIEKEQERMRELNKNITLPSEIPIGQILSTPQTTTVPEPLITPDVPEQKTKVEDVGFTESKRDPSDFIMTSEDVPKEPKERSKFYYEQIGLKQRQEPEDAMLEATRFHSGVLAKSLEDIGDLSHRITEGSPGAVLEKVNRQIKMLEDQDYRMPFLKNHEQNILGNAKYKDMTVEEYKSNLDSLLKNYVSAHEKLPTYNPIHQAAKDAAISIGKLDVDSALENLYFLRDELKKGEDYFKEQSLSLSEKGDISKTNEETTGTRQEEGQTAIEALKAQSEQTQRGDVDRGSQSDQGEYVLKTEEGFEIAPLEQSSDFFTRTMLGEIGTPKSTYQPIVDLSEIGQTFNIFEEKRSGNFENHIFTSIPTFKEAQVATADALIKSLPKNANVLDIGGTEGGFINTIAEVRPDVTGFIVDPNVVANKIFNQQQMSNAYYIRSAFTTDKSKFGNYAFDVKDEKKQPISTDFFDANLIEDNSLDAITEKMTFQFIDKGRNNKVKLISEKLKPTGIALFEEKFFTSYDDPEWKANEDKKNQFKLQYYDQKDLTKKQKETLEGMDKRQVTSGDFEKILMKHFNNVVQYWDSGNFKGYVASDSADALNNFLSNLPDLNSEYSNVQTPNFITKPIDKKRRGGPISIPKIDML
jgi:hypothetical protein